MTTDEITDIQNLLTKLVKERVILNRLVQAARRAESSTPWVWEGKTHSEHFDAMREIYKILQELDK